MKIRGLQPKTLALQPSHGYTLIEMLVAVAVIGILIALAMTSVPSLIAEQRLEQARDLAVSVVEDARARTLASKDAGAGEGSVYGVYMNDVTNPHQLELFSGAAYDVGNVVRTSLLPSGVILQSVTFPANIVVFQRLTGEASSAGSVTLYSAPLDETRMISVTRQGLVE